MVGHVSLSLSLFLSRTWTPPLPTQCLMHQNLHRLLCCCTGLARAQLLHAYVSLLNEVVNMDPSAAWHLDTMVMTMLSSMRHIEANYHKFESVAEGHWEALRAPLHCVVCPISR
jgi:hypothetical protein